MKLSSLDPSSVTRQSSASASPHRGWIPVQNRYAPSAGPTSRRQKLTISLVLTLARRVLNIVAAVHFVSIEFAATHQTLNILRNVAIPEESFGSHDSNLLAGYLGSGSIRDSPLVMNVLSNNTTPRNSALYLWSETEAEFKQCEESATNSLYANASLFALFNRVFDSASYNLTYFRELELVVPVVDCSFEGMEEKDVSVARIYNIIRSKSNPDDAYIMSIDLSLQEYSIPEHSHKGPAFLGTMSLMNDLRANTIPIYYFMALDYPFAVPEIFLYEFLSYESDGSCILRSIPRPDMTIPATVVYTARRRGFYFNSETEQSNIVTTYRKIHHGDALNFLTRMEWVGRTSINDSWAWVHGIHCIFGMQTLLTIIVLFVIVFRNWQRGKIWIGDAFASVSNRMLIARMVLVLVSWQANDYWVLTEFALSNASQLSGVRKIPIRAEFVTADMLVIMLGLFGVIGWLANVRIDPALGFYLFVSIHTNRLAVVRLVPALVSYISNYANTEYLAGIASASDIVVPHVDMWLWTTHKLTAVSGVFICGTFFPKFTIALIVIAYAVARRVYSHYHPDQAANYSGRSRTAKSTSSESEAVEKGHITAFEIATGALLRNRFGLISDYKNYVFIKGMRYASADGIYCSGYVVANGKFLVATDDLFSIVLMKLLHSRLYNVYVYEIDCNSVQQTARLVYPGTLSWNDILMLNITILS